MEKKHLPSKIVQKGVQESNNWESNPAYPVFHTPYDLKCFMIASRPDFY
jgi:hypothetical protein